MTDIKAIEKKTELMKAKNEELDQEVSEAQKRAAIAEAKKAYGRDWKKIIGGAVGKLKIDKETLVTLHSMGTGGQELRNLSNPQFLKRR